MVKKGNESNGFVSQSCMPQRVVSTLGRKVARTGSAALTHSRMNVPATYLNRHMATAFGSFCKCFDYRRNRSFFPFTFRFMLPCSLAMLSFLKHDHSERTRQILSKPLFSDYHFTCAILPVRPVVTTNLFSCVQQSHLPEVSTLLSI
jgi:hypothetical protein